MEEDGDEEHELPAIGKTGCVSADYGSLIIVIIESASIIEPMMR